MVQKRQLAEEAYDVSSKHLKLENSCRLVSCLEFPSKDVPLKPCSSALPPYHKLAADPQI
ncbi:hypothetical protein HanHA89_Chr05g0204591 [Helianthus annuus]|nr:hypothetical protein HanHA89_Chr05g0204591 [Helianthus annuus]